MPSFQCFVNKDPSAALPDEVTLAIRADTVLFMSSEEGGKRLKEIGLATVVSYKATVDPEFMDLFAFEVKGEGTFSLEIEEVGPLEAAWKKATKRSKRGSDLVSELAGSSAGSGVDGKKKPKTRTTMVCTICSTKYVSASGKDICPKCRKKDTGKAKEEKAKEVEKAKPEEEKVEVEKAKPDEGLASEDEDRTGVENSKRDKKDKGDKKESKRNKKDKRDKKESKRDKKERKMERKESKREKKDSKREKKDRKKEDKKKEKNRKRSDSSDSGSCSDMDAGNQSDEGFMADLPENVADRQELCSQHMMLTISKGVTYFPNRAADVPPPIPTSFFPLARFLMDSGVPLPKSVSVIDVREVKEQTKAQSTLSALGLRKTSFLFGGKVDEEFLIKVVYPPPRPSSKQPVRAPKQGWFPMTDFVTFRDSIPADDLDLLAKYAFPEETHKHLDYSTRQARARQVGTWLTQFIFLARQQECSPEATLFLVKFLEHEEVLEHVQDPKAAAARQMDGSRGALLATMSEGGEEAEGEKGEKGEKGEGGGAKKKAPLVRQGTIQRRQSLVVSAELATDMRDLKKNLHDKYDRMHALLKRSHELYLKNQEGKPEMDPDFFKFEDSLLYANREPTNSLRPVRMNIKTCLGEIATIMKKKDFTEHRLRSGSSATHQKVGKLNDTHADNKCSVCFLQIKRPQVVKIFPCGHFFHCDRDRGHDCIDPWLRAGNNHCPSCSAPLLDEEKQSLMREMQLASGEFPTFFC